MVNSAPNRKTNFIPIVARLGMAVLAIAFTINLATKTASADVALATEFVPSKYLSPAAKALHIGPLRIDFALSPPSASICAYDGHHHNRVNGRAVALVDDWKTGPLNDRAPVTIEVTRRSSLDFTPFERQSTPTMEQLTIRPGQSKTRLAALLSPAFYTAAIPHPHVQAQYDATLNKSSRSLCTSVLMCFRARCYDTEKDEFIKRDPLGYVDGMSQYRGYFVPGGVDPSGTCFEEQYLQCLALTNPAQTIGIAIGCAGFCTLGGDPNDECIDACTDFTLKSQASVPRKIACTCAAYAQCR